MRLCVFEEVVACGDTLKKQVKTISIWEVFEPLRTKVVEMSLCSF